MKYAILDKNGLPMAFYSDDIHSNIPKEAIEITDEQWLECINNQGQRKFENGEVVEYTTPIVVTIPQVLTPKQARLALLQAGLYDTVNQAVKLTPTHEIYWEYALEVRRDDALLIELSTALAITSEQLDGLFELGSTL